MNRSHPATGAAPAALGTAAGGAEEDAPEGSCTTAPCHTASYNSVTSTATLPAHTSDGQSGGPLRREVFRLPACGASVSAARNRVASRLAYWGIAQSVYEDAELIVSELFTNALIHTDSSEITCQLRTTAHTVYLAITDQGQGPTGPRVREPDTESGRGLLLVSALAQLWGVNTE